MRRLLVTVAAAAVLFGWATPLRAATPSLNASITRQITADRAALAQTQSRQRRFVRQLRVAESKSATVSDPFDYEDGVARLRLAAASAARQVSALNAAIVRLKAALQPIELPEALNNTATTDPFGWDAVAVAEHFLGVRYLWGGSNPGTGFDCSGFVKFVYAQLGLTLAHYAATQYATTPHISESVLEAGDLVFFEPRADGPGHVAIYIGDGELIEAPHTGDVVKIAPLSTLTAGLGFVGATRPSELMLETATA